MRASLDGGASKLHLARVILNLLKRLATQGPAFFTQKEAAIRLRRVCDLPPCGVVRKRNWVGQWLISRPTGSAFEFKPIRLNKRYGGKYGGRSCRFHGLRRLPRNKLSPSGRDGRGTPLP